MDGTPVNLRVNSDLLDVRMTVEIGTAKAFELKLPGRVIKYDVVEQKLNDTPLKPIDGRITVQVLADRSLTEIIGNEGRVYISGAGPSSLDISTTPLEISITAVGGKAQLFSLEAHEIKSIWNE